MFSRIFRKKKCFLNESLKSDVITSLLTSIYEPCEKPGGRGGAEGLVLGARFPKPDAQPSAGAYERQEQ